jgi:hypothetical protein
VIMTKIVTMAEIKSLKFDWSYAIISSLV